LPSQDPALALNQWQTEAQGNLRPPLHPYLLPLSQKIVLHISSFQLSLSHFTFGDSYQSALGLAVSLDGLPRLLHTALIFAFARDIGRRRDGRRAHFSLHLPTLRVVRMCHNACLFLHLPFLCYVSSAVFRARQIFDESAEAIKATSATMLKCTFLFHIFSRY
jgi:hypothetical protein